VRRILIVAITTSATLVFGQIGSAADMPTKAAPASVAAPAPPSWTGFYLGLNVGPGWRSDSDLSWVDPNFLLGVPASVPSPRAIPTGSDAGIVGSIHGGYNWQFAPRRGYILDGYS